MAQKIALVGIGKIAIDQHIPTLLASQQWDLCATVSRSDVSSVAALDGIEAFNDLDALLTARPDINVISLCIPPKPRFDAAQKALRAKRHVMLEKPPTATLSAAKALADLAQAQNVTLFATWHSRHGEKVAAAKAWLANQKLKSLKVKWHEDVRQWHPGQDWVFETGGLGVFDPGINAISIVTEILSEPIHLLHAQLSFPQNRDTPIAAWTEFAHPHGAKVEMDFNWLATGKPTWTIEVETDKGHLLLENGGGKLTIDGKTEESVPGLQGEYPRLYAQMAEMVAAGTSETDFSPLRHVADAFLLGKRQIVESFEWSIINV